MNFRILAGCLERGDKLLAGLGGRPVVQFAGINPNGCGNRFEFWNADVTVGVKGEKRTVAVAILSKGIFGPLRGRVDS